MSLRSAMMIQHQNSNQVFGKRKACLSQENYASFLCLEN